VTRQLQFAPSEFQAFRDFLQNTAGIDLGENKQYLVSTRVRRIMLENKFSSLSDLTNAISLKTNTVIRQQVLDAMTTNETFWFRDLYPYNYLSQTLLPAWHKEGKSRYRIWSAACSSGQEPYSISMIIQEYIRKNYNLENMPIEIVATDLSNSVLESAMSGKFDKLSVSRGLEGSRLKDWFTQGDSDSWKVKDIIKQRVQFRPLNLLESYTLMGKFDAVFCRNVLIYFSVGDKTDILKRIHRTLNKGGKLFLGSSENPGQASELFETQHIPSGVVYSAD